MPAALAAYWSKRRPKKRAGRRGKVTITTSRTVRRQNPNHRYARRALIVLYAIKGADRLKYLGGIKFGKQGRAKLFNSVSMANLTAKMLREFFPGPLKGFRMVALRASQ